MVAKEMLEIRILDEFGCKVYKGRAEISNKEKIAELLSILMKYGIDLYEISMVPKNL